MLGGVAAAALGGGVRRWEGDDIAGRGLGSVGIGGEGVSRCEDRGEGGFAKYRRNSRGPGGRLSEK